MSAASGQARATRLGSLPDEIAAVARDVIQRVGATGPADKGKVMPVIMAELRDKAEGRDINAVVTDLLSGA